MSDTLMAKEIREQPEVLRRILQEGWHRIREVAEIIRKREPRFVLFVARGTSDHAAIYAKYLVETCLHLPAGLVSPSTSTLYGAQPRFQDVLVIAVSQSGASPDLVEPLTRAQVGGALTLALTNAAGSPLATTADFHIDILAGAERSVAATKTYTAELFTLYLLVQALQGKDCEEAMLLPQRVEMVCDREEEVRDLTVRYRFAEQIVITSRGYNYPTALEAALKLMETNYLVAHGFSAADLLHGPMAMISRGFPVIVISPGGAGGAALAPVLDQLGKLKADTLVIGEPSAASQATVGLALSDLGPEILTPILTILPLQQFALHLALARGENPDEPRGLRKVTETW